MEILKILSDDSINIEDRIEQVLTLLTKKLKIKFSIRCIKEIEINGNKTVFDLLTDERSIKVIQVCELYLKYKATYEELQLAAADASTAARAAYHNDAVDCAHAHAAFASYYATYHPSRTNQYIYYAAVGDDEVDDDVIYAAGRKIQLKILKEMFTEIESNA